MGKTYLVCPDFDVPPPPTGPIQLGHIITILSEPCDSLNSDYRLDIPQDKVYNSWKNSWKAGFVATRTQLRDGAFGLWAQFLEGIGFGGEISYKFDKNVNDIYTFDRIETSFFVPSPEYYRKSVLVPPVQDYLKDSRYKLPLYMITGLKVVRGGTVTRTNSEGHEEVAKLGFDGVPAAVPVKVGPEAQYSSQTKEITSFDSSSDFVFAIRLRKLTCSKDGKVRVEAYDKGAMLGQDDEPTNVDSEGLVVNVAEEDAGLEDFKNMRTVSIVDDD